MIKLLKILLSIKKYKKCLLVFKIISGKNARNRKPHSEFNIL